MVKRIFTIIISLVVMAGFMCMDINAYGANDNGITIEQIKENMPELTVYFRVDEDENVEDINCYIDNERLITKSIKKLSELDDSTAYYVLVDISASVREDYFTEAKKSVLNLYKKLSKNDLLSVISFGDSVTEVCNSSMPKEDFTKKLNNLKANDDNTNLNGAIDFAAGVSEKNRNEAVSRCVCILLTDGAEYSVGSVTYNEVVNKLTEKNLPLYTVIYDYALKSDISTMGEMSRSSGGDIFVSSSGKISNTFEDISNMLGNTYVGKFEASSNKVDNKVKTVLLKNDITGVSVAKDVRLTRFAPDFEAPEIISVEKVSTNRMVISFSEKVINADDASNYIIEYSSSHNDRYILPVSAKYSEGNDEFKCDLIFNEELYRGAYKISTKNIYDVSNEKNAVTNEFSTRLSGHKEETVTGINPIVIVIIITVIVLLTLSIILIIAKQKREKMLENNLLPEDDSYYSLQDKQKRHHVRFVDDKDNTLDILICVSGKKPEKMSIDFSKILLVGRSPECGLFFDDGQMSRKHFVIEAEGNDLYISDLGTTNGTILNGVKIQNKRRLNINDTVFAGTVEMRIVNFTSKKER